MKCPPSRLFLSAFCKRKTNVKYVLLSQKWKSVKHLYKLLIMKEVLIYEKRILLMLEGHCCC